MSNPEDKNEAVRTNWTPESGLRAQYPDIRWDEPQPIEIGDKIAWCCRYCVATEGLSGLQVLKDTAGYGSYSEARKHIRKAHA